MPNLSFGLDLSFLICHLPFPVVILNLFQDLVKELLPGTMKDDSLTPRPKITTNLSYHQEANKRTTLKSKMTHDLLEINQLRCHHPHPAPYSFLA